VTVHSVWAYNAQISGQLLLRSITPIQIVGLIGEGENRMMPFVKCPVCGGELVEKKVEKLLRGGKNTAILEVDAEVCLRCGERLYPQETEAL
jgi:YgiT-type zinc finger domain-containing protein